jgi:hypothetical protein
MFKAETLVHENSASVPQVRPVEGVPTRVDLAFTNKAGVVKNGIRKDTEKMLRNLRTPLQRLLAPDEFVVYVAGACAPMSGVEQYTFGYFAQFVSRVALVFTNKRLLAFRVNHKGAWRNSLRGCPWGDVQSGKLTGWLLRCLKLQYANGKKESYWALKARDKAKLNIVVPKLLEANAGAQTHAQSMQPLCPTCAATLVERQYECTACGQKFRSEDSLWWRTFIPGGAYFYAKQTGMGIMHAIGDTFIFLETLVLFAAALAAKPQSKTPAKPQDFWLVFGVFFLLLLFERSIALWHARRFVREFIPIEETARRQSAAVATSGR